MKKYLIVFFLFVSSICTAQIQNSLNVYYGIPNSVLFEYGYLKYNKYSDQLVGVDIGIGHVFKDKALKTTLGFRGVQLKSSGWHQIYKIGIVVYEFKYFDVFIGFGVERKRFQVITKLNLIRTFGKFNEEWGEIGIGFSF